jgi:multiple sugar transport system ATP-binding protein
MRVEIAKLHKRVGATMVYVTHDQIEAMTLGDRIVVMKDGEVQQIDTPMRLYERPANVFVAGFLGSPAMNFFEGRVDGSHIAIGSALLPAPQGTTLASEVLVGVRPEDLVLAPDGAGALEAKLEVVEPVGNEIFLNLRHDDRAIVMRVPPQALPETGSTLRIAIRPGRVHFFDAKTERRIDAP